MLLEDIIVLVSLTNVIYGHNMFIVQANDLTYKGRVSDVTVKANYLPYNGKVSDVTVKANYLTYNGKVSDVTV
jgi:hypothetical protein